MRGFYRRWILANGWSEGLGLGTTFILAGVLVPIFDGGGAAVLVFGALVAVMLGMLLEGILVGAAQERVLRQRLRWVEPGTWTAATAVGAGLAWALGMVPSTVIGLRGGAGGEVAEPGTMATMLLAVALGLVAGPVLGAAQWVVLRRHVHGAGRWLWANAAAWALGMPLVFAGMERVPWTGPPAARAAALLIVCGVVGLVVGAVHGAVLVRLVGSPRFRVVEPRRAA